MKKNSQIHFFIETDILESLKLKAKDEGITLSKLCREKLREYGLLIKVFETLEKINNKISKEEEILHLMKIRIISCRKNLMEY